MQCIGITRNLSAAPAHLPPSQNSACFGVSDPLLYRASLLLLWPNQQCHHLSITEMQDLESEPRPAGSRPHLPWTCLSLGEFHPPGDESSFT